MRYLILIMFLPANLFAVNDTMQTNTHPLTQEISCSNRIYSNHQNTIIELEKQIKTTSDNNEQNQLRQIVTSFNVQIARWLSQIASCKIVLAEINKYPTDIQTNTSSAFQV